MYEQKGKGYEENAADMQLEKFQTRGISRFFFFSLYGKCPKILYTKSSNRMAYANNVDPDQTAPKGAV